MKFSAFVLVALLGLAKTAWCDTIPVWHVYLNDSMVADLNHYNADSTTLNFSIQTLKQNDTLIVNYLNDIPCDDCGTKLVTRDENGIEKIVASGNEAYEPLKVPMLDLIKQSTSSRHLEFYYLKDDCYKIKLFTLKFSA